VTDRSDRPLSSDEMLKQARRGLQQPESAEPPPDPRRPESPPPPRVRPPEPTSAPRPGRRPTPPERRTQPPIDAQAQRRAVILAAIGVALVIAGFVAAIVFAGAGV
jgi:hypothetical protein